MWEIGPRLAETLQVIAWGLTLTGTFWVLFRGK